MHKMSTTTPEVIRDFFISFHHRHLCTLQDRQHPWYISAHYSSRKTSINYRGVTEGHGSCHLRLIWNWNFCIACGYEVEGCPVRTCSRESGLGSSLLVKINIFLQEWKISDEDKWLSTGSGHLIVNNSLQYQLLCCEWSNYQKIYLEKDNGFIKTR